MIEYKFIEKNEFLPLLKEFVPKVFTHSTDINLEELYSEMENEKSKQLGAIFNNGYRIYLTAWDNDKLAGWSWGYQKDGKEFYMCNSGVLPEYRRQNVYTELMNRIVDKATSDGFKEITSRHHSVNNAILIPKLKAGFVILGFEVNPRFGVMINLVKYNNPKVLDVHLQRSGFRGQA